jgi:hypothetical protein
MRWGTRAGVHIDRASSAWLIRCFVDTEAEFVFVTDPDDVPADATAFDMRGVDYGHHGDDCTFETILRRHDLADPVLWRIAAIIHEATSRTIATTPPKHPVSMWSCADCP